jgi:SAM-dependent methyltransferase
VSQIEYVGDELTLFSEAHNWKRYLADRLTPYIAGDVLEVGAGLGATTRTLSTAQAVKTWTCIEPDPHLADGLNTAVAKLAVEFPIRTAVGVLADLDPSVMFDTILYIDVLEHIEDDRAEAKLAAKHLRAGGNLVVLCPAFQFLFSNFDTAIGHFRRYNRTTLRSVKPSSLTERTSFYMDSVGVLASLLNKAALRQSLPTKQQVAAWDRIMVPTSRLADPLVRLFGKSVIAIWTK